MSRQFSVGLLGADENVAAPSVDAEAAAGFDVSNGPYKRYFDESIFEDGRTRRSWRFNANHEQYEQRNIVTAENVVHEGGNVNHFYYTVTEQVDGNRLYKEMIVDHDDTARLLVYLFKFQAQLEAQQSAEGKTLNLNNVAALSLPWLGLMRYREYLMKAHFVDNQHDTSKERTDTDWQMVCVAMNTGIAGIPDPSQWNLVVDEFIHDLVLNPQDRKRADADENYHFKHSISIPQNDLSAVAKVNALIRLYNAMLLKGIISPGSTMDLFAKGMEKRQLGNYAVQFGSGVRSTQNVLLKCEGAALSKYLDPHFIEKSGKEWRFELSCKIPLAKIRALECEREIETVVLDVPYIPFPCPTTTPWEEFLMLKGVPQAEIDASADDNIKLPVAVAALELSEAHSGAGYAQEDPAAVAAAKLFSFNKEAVSENTITLVFSSCIKALRKKKQPKEDKYPNPMITIKRAPDTILASIFDELQGDETHLGNYNNFLRYILSQPVADDARVKIKVMQQKVLARLRREIDASEDVTVSAGRPASMFPAVVPPGEAGASVVAAQQLGASSPVPGLGSSSK